MLLGGRGRAPPHRHCTPRLRSAHLQSSPNAQSLAERIAAPDPKVRVGRGLRASGGGCAQFGMASIHHRYITRMTACEEPSP